MANSNLSFKSERETQQVIQRTGEKLLQVKDMPCTINRQLNRRIGSFLSPAILFFGREKQTATEKKTTEFLLFTILMTLMMVTCAINAGGSVTTDRIFAKINFAVNQLATQRELKGGFEEKTVLICFLFPRLCELESDSALKVHCFFFSCL